MNTTYVATVINRCLIHYGHTRGRRGRLGGGKIRVIEASGKLGGRGRGVGQPTSSRRPLALPGGPRRVGWRPHAQWGRCGAWGRRWRGPRGEPDLRARHARLSYVEGFEPFRGRRAKISAHLARKLPSAPQQRHPGRACSPQEACAGGSPRLATHGPGAAMRRTGPRRTGRLHRQRRRRRRARTRLFVSDVNVDAVGPGVVWLPVVCFMVSKKLGEEA